MNDRTYTITVHVYGNTMSEIITTAFAEVRPATGPDAALTIETFPSLHHAGGTKKFWGDVVVSVHPAPAKPRQVVVDADTLKAGLDWAMSRAPGADAGWKAYNTLRIALGKADTEGAGS